MLNPLMKIEFLREGRGARLPLMIIFYNAILALVTIMIMLVNSQSYMEGYYYDPSDIQENAESEMDTYQLKVPAHDRATFSTLMSRMGWIASSLKKNLGKIASL